VATTFPDVLIDLDSDKELDGAGGAAEETSEQAVHGGVVFMREATIGDNAKIVGHDLTMNVTTTTPLLELPPSRQYEPTGDYQIDQVQQTLGDLGQLNLLGEQHGADDVPLEKLFPQLSQLFQRGAFEDHPCRQNEKSMKLLLYAATASELVLLETRPTIHVHGTKGDLEAYDELRREVRAMRKELAAVFGDAFSLADHIQKHGKRKESFVDALPDPVNPERCEAAEPHRDRAVELARKLFDTG
jgi:hypothetical protein